MFPARHILDRLARLRVGHSHRPLSCLVASALILGSLFAVVGPSEGQGSTCSGGRSLQGDPSNYLSLVNGLQPCDTLTLAAGTYTTELRITNLNGTASQHIVIKGPDTGPRPLFLGNPVSNVVEIGNTSYVELKNIDINAQKLGGDGVNFKGLAHDVVLDNLSLRGLSDDQQTVAISANHAPSWNITIRNCVITDAGTGMYLGNSDGSNQFLNGLIENNLIYDTIGYNIEIKYQNPLPTNIADLPLTTTHTIIRDNVFSKANNASGDSLARPNLLVGHAPLSGPGQDNFFEIYGNFFYQNPVEALFQGEGNFALYDNLFFNSMNSGTPAIAIQPHINLPRAVRVFNNTVVTVNTGISLTGGSSSYAQKVIGNAVFSPSPIQAADQFGNITGTYQNASNYLNNPFAALGSMDLFPKVGELSGTALDTSSFNTYTDFEQDFNGTVRTTASFRGAYFGEGQNPGWLPQIAIKPVSVTGASPATLSLAFNGLLRDRVGQDNTALGPDGALDGTLTATLSASGGRTVTALRLDSNAPGTWDTFSGNGFWALAVAPTLDGAILNAPGTMAVNFPVADGGSFVVFAADYQGGEFLLGRTLTLTATFSDGSTATAVTTVTSASPATLSLVYHGLLRDRVGQGTTALGPDGALDGTLTATLSASGGRTVTALRLDSSAPGIWDTLSGSPFWVLAVAPTLDGAVLNAPGTMAVNFPVADGGSFVVFAADYQGGEFLPGRSLTLTATFSDGSTATTTTTVP